MNSVSLNYLAQQVMYQGPVLLVAPVGLVLSFVFLGRYRWPSLLTLIGTTILLVSTVGVMAAQMYVLQVRTQGVFSQTSRQVSSVIAIVGSLARGLGIGLLLAAAFIGHKQSPTITA